MSHNPYGHQGPGSISFHDCHDFLMDAPIGIYMSTPEGRFLSANPAMARMFGYETPEELIASITDIAKELYADPVQREEFKRLLKEHGEVKNQEFQMIRRDGSIIWVSRSGRALRDREGKVMHYQGFVTDITKRKQYEEHLRILATTDEMTGLRNRRFFMQAFEQEMERSRRFGQSFSLLMMDIDHFKLINDEHGHAAGDLALRNFASVLQEHLRQVDVPGRLGGEEFAALLLQTDLEEAIAVAERLRKNVALMEFDCNGRSIRFTVSIGVAAYSPEVSSVDELLKRADNALYRAKKSGRNQTITG